ncbi:MAG: PEP-CTERM sorting domain-containing protein [Prosthecobacter sp.]|uniref:PEP-CTERM sorting domain-containing protein n=1 Tax=Prosthecobacter sp. TaxID=1965333 RepID=UPI00390224A7
MTLRSITYWLICSITAVIAVGAAEPGVAATLSFTLPDNASSMVHTVPEPSRALLLFAGIMAMAFTYRKAWLSWKQSE